MPYGRQLLTSDQIFPTRVTADGSPKYKAGGITLALATLAAALSADLTLPDGSILRSGTQYLRYGQILTRIAGESQTVTVASATGGTFTLTYAGQTTTALAYNVSAADMEAALAALSTVGLGNVHVSGPASGVYTVTFSSTLGNASALTATDSTTGSGHSVTPATSAAGTTSSGMYGPYDPAATDGRQTLARGSAYILDEIYVVNPSGSRMPSSNEIIGGVFEGGDVWRERLLITTGVHSLAAGPTVAEFETVFPRISYTGNN